jgi:hypothetical protein
MEVWLIKLRLRSAARSIAVAAAVVPRGKQEIVDSRRGIPIRSSLNASGRDQARIESATTFSGCSKQEDDMNEIKSREQLEQAQRDKQHQIRVDTATEEILATRFGANKFLIKDREASRIAILQMCADYCSIPVSVCVPSKEIMLEIYRYQKPAFMAAFGSGLLDSVENVRRELLNEITQTILDGRPSITREELQNERSRLGYFTIQQLRNRLSMIREAQRLCKHTPARIREELAADRAANEPLPPQLPYGRRELHLKMMKMTRAETDYFVQKWGLRVINARLDGSDGFVEVPNTQADGA